jgi:hypothetical protein
LRTKLASRPTAEGSRVARVCCQPTYHERDWLRPLDPDGTRHRFPTQPTSYGAAHYLSKLLAVLPGGLSGTPERTAGAPRTYALDMLLRRMRGG